MPLQLDPDDVSTWTGTVVSADAITVAAEQIDKQTGYTVDEHSTARAVSDLSIRMAWALVAVRVHEALRNDTAGGLTSETQGDYTYTADAGLVRLDRFRQLLDGRPSELLEIDDRAIWTHR